MYDGATEKEKVKKMLWNGTAVLYPTISAAVYFSNISCILIGLTACVVLLLPLVGDAGDPHPLHTKKARWSRERKRQRLSNQDLLSEQDESEIINNFSHEK